MTYKLEPGMGRIISPITIILPDGNRINYQNGTEATAAVFEKRYVIETIRANENAIEFTLKETETVATSWTGEEQTFF